MNNQRHIDLAIEFLSQDRITVADAERIIDKAIYYECKQIRNPETRKTKYMMMKHNAWKRLLSTTNALMGWEE